MVAGGDGRRSGGGAAAPALVGGAEDPVEWAPAFGGELAVGLLVRGWPSRVRRVVSHRGQALSTRIPGGPAGRGGGLPVRPARNGNGYFHARGDRALGHG